jgi:predicted glycogen debranching enzyme
VEVAAAECQDLARALSLEWLETNGRGGFASGTVAGANTRRYHAVLLIARKPPVERFTLVNHLEEWVELDGRAIPLSTNLYPGAVHPAGYAACSKFSSTPWPTWTFDCGRAAIQRELVCVPGRDLVIVRWKLVGAGPGPAFLRVRPMLSGRDSHLTHHENSTLSTAALTGSGWVSWQPYADVPTVRAIHPGTYRHDPDWYRRIQFPVERERGLDDEEDWWSPGELRLDLVSGQATQLILTTEQTGQCDAETLLTEERARRDRRGSAAPNSDPLAVALWRATDTYLSQRGNGHTVLAGYPWFTDWGRDTFMSLPGLCLVTGRYDVAWSIIAEGSAHVSEGMVPNRWSDRDDQPEYNTIDASLWFVHAVERYHAYTQDDARVRSVAWPAVKQILDRYRRGTRYDIHMDRDGLIAGGTSGVQVTWMDARVGEWVVTPRHGKPVEVQALWMRALEAGSRLAERFGEPAYAARCRRERELAARSFRARFWHEGGGYLYDVIDGPEGDDSSIRPNQIYPLALCRDVVPLDQARRVLTIVLRHLLTPVGLRTLSPSDPRYRPRYEGGVRDRDGAYHQGTVWPFLLGPFITAWLNVYGRDSTRRADARSFLDGLERHLDEACMGQVSEIFDGDAPHLPRGCPAQAWSVAEPLRVLMEDLGIPYRSLDSR